MRMKSFVFWFVLPAFILWMTNSRSDFLYLYWVFYLLNSLCEIVSYPLFFLLWYTNSSLYPLLGLVGGVLWVLLSRRAFRLGPRLEPVTILSLGKRKEGGGFSGFAPAELLVKGSKKRFSSLRVGDSLLRAMGERFAEGWRGECLLQGNAVYAVRENGSVHYYPNDARRLVASKSLFLEVLRFFGAVYSLACAAAMFAFSLSVPFSSILLGFLLIWAGAFHCQCLIMVERKQMRDIRTRIRFYSRKAARAAAAPPPATPGGGE